MAARRRAAQAATEARELRSQGRKVRGTVGEVAWMKWMRAAARAWLRPEKKMCAGERRARVWRVIAPMPEVPPVMKMTWLVRRGKAKRSRSYFSAMLRVECEG